MPIMAPVRVSAESPMRAMPKSVTTTRPSSASITLYEVTSRWTMCRPCAAPSAESTARAIWTASSGGSAPSRRRRCFSVSPGTYSMAMYVTPSAVPRSYTPTMLAWLRLAAACASMRKRSTNSSSAASLALSTLTATWRPSRSSSAR